MEATDKFGLFTWRSTTKTILSILTFFIGFVISAGILERQGFDLYVLVAFLISVTGAIGLANSEKRWFKFTVEF